MKPVMKLVFPRNTCPFRQTRWADPDNDMVYVFLSNRVYPNAWNNKLGRMNIRPKIQQVLYDALGH